MATYSRVWDALTAPGEADQLHTRSQLLHGLQQLITSRGYNTEQAAQHLQISVTRAGRLIAGDINEFSLAELRGIHTSTQSPPA